VTSRDARRDRRAAEQRDETAPLQIDRTAFGPRRPDMQHASAGVESEYAAD